MAVRDALLSSAAGGAPVAVLEQDAGLRDAVARPRLRRAIAASTGGVIRVPAGMWEATEAAEPARGGCGLLVLDGVLLRSVGIDRRFGAELLSSGDVLRPWEHDGDAGPLPFDMTWRVVADARLAVLDLRWAARMAPFPEVAAELIGRATARSLRLVTL